MPDIAEIVELDELLAETKKPRGGVNRQLFENSTIRDEVVVCDLHNAKNPNLAIQHEKPEHRIVLCLKLKGMSHTEIAKATGYTIPWISQVCRQPWFRERLTQELECAQEQIAEEIIRLESANSVHTLIELRDDASQPGSVRRAAASDLLDRYLGKPVQRNENLNINATAKNVIVRNDEVAEQIAQLENEIRTLQSPRREAPLESTSVEIKPATI